MNRRQGWLLRTAVETRSRIVPWPAGGWAPAGEASLTCLGLRAPRRAATRRDVLTLEDAGMLERAYDQVDPAWDARALTLEGWTTGRALLPKKLRAAVPETLPKEGWDEERSQEG